MNIGVKEEMDKAERRPSQYMGHFYRCIDYDHPDNVINLLGVDPNLQGLVKGIIIIVAVLLQRIRNDG